MLIHAGIRVSDFYARLGFSAGGEPFVEDGIAHIAMRADLGAVR